MTSSSSEKISINNKRNYDEFRDEIEKLRAIVCPDETISRYKVLGRTVALLTGTPYNPQYKRGTKPRQWYRDREDESLEELRTFLKNKGDDGPSKRLKRSFTLQKIIEYLERQKLPQASTSAPAPSLPVPNIPFSISNILEKNPFAPPPQLLPVGYFPSIPIQNVALSPFPAGHFNIPSPSEANDDDEIIDVVG